MAVTPAPPIPATSYRSLTLIYNEDLKQWVSQATYQAQILLPVPGRGLYSLPLPGQAQTPAGNYSLWRHRARAATGELAFRAGYYGIGHPCHVSFVLLGTGQETTKMLDNLLLVSDGVDPHQLQVQTSEEVEPKLQPVRGKEFSIVQRNATRSEGHTYLTVEGLGKGKKHRGRWLKLQLSWLPALTSQQQGKLSKVISTVRDSFR